MNTPVPMRRLCHVGELAGGTAKGFAAAGVFALRHAGRVHVWRDACPHLGGTPLAWRRDAYLNAAATRIVCAAHGAEFAPDTGLCTLGPCLGQSLARVPFRIGADGTIAIDAPSLETTQDTST